MLRVTCVRRRSSAELERVRDASHDRLCALLLLFGAQLRKRKRTMLPSKRTTRRSLGRVDLPALSLPSVRLSQQNTSHARDGSLTVSHLGTTDSDMLDGALLRCVLARRHHWRRTRFCLSTLDLLRICIATCASARTARPLSACPRPSPRGPASRFPRPQFDSMREDQRTSCQNAHTPVS